MPGTWRRPAGFVRKVWDFETTLGASPHWGDWRRARGLAPDGRALLERCAGAARWLAAHGSGPETFGLIHADLRLANLLVDGDRLGVIDFDDCGFGWFLYDFAAAVSFFEHDPAVGGLAEAWTAGYRRVAPLAEADCAALPALVMCAGCCSPPGPRATRKLRPRGRPALLMSRAACEFAERFLSARGGQVRSGLR